MCMLAIIYYAGELVDKNYTKAFELFKLGAEHNDPHSIFAVGFYYLEGLGEIEKNRTLGKEYITRAAKLGHKNAKVFTGIFENDNDNDNENTIE